MPLEYTFICPLPNGMHARPASLFAEIVAAFKSSVSLINERTGNKADAASVLDLISVDIRNNDRCRIIFSGDDEKTAYSSVVKFIENVLPGCDEPLPKPQSQGNVKMPRLLDGLDVTCLPGNIACGGIGIGRVVSINGFTLQADSTETAKDPIAERKKLKSAINAVRSDMESMIAGKLSSVEADVLRAHLSLINDAALVREIVGLIDSGRTGGQAVVNAIEKFAEKLENTGSEYMRERAIDLRDIGIQLLERMNIGVIKQREVVLTEPSIVVASSLAPRQLLSLDRKLLCGLILKQAGATSHAVILARSFGIPTVTGIADACTKAGEVVVDAERGMVLFPVSDEVRRFYEREIERQALRHAHLTKFNDVPVVTCDGVRLEIAANIATGSEVEATIANGAEGIGLFRTEMLFSERPSPPSEDEQFEIYAHVARTMGERPVIIRTLDAGGDKPLPYLNQTVEENPFLGCRGIRLYRNNIELITNQIRAIVRASAFGHVKVMAPMVCSIDEARWFLELVRSVQADFGETGVEYGREMQIGIMIEVPSAAMMIDKLCDVVDFFSIGTNDLCQYLLAVERGNPKVSSIYNERHPAFVRLLKSIADCARSRGKWVGMCGEMAGKVENLPLLVGLGLNEISLSAPNIAAIRNAVSSLDTGRCRQIVESAIDCRDASEVDLLLNEFVVKLAGQPLLDANLIITQSNSRTKAEVIKELVDLLYVARRTDSCDEVEEAIWARETVYSTGLGHGFAIPHCKTDNLKANSLAVLKLAHPIEWGSIDDKPVSFVILLAIRESDRDNSHMRIFSILARKLMDEDFRQLLSTAKNSNEILLRLSSELT
ncbi:MAG: phosphoenolpyruvate--protein phosphotransferase [Armatimonadota bacterium]|nr:phosphoenolpyruvate--protein phosphotransferase [bacterium]